MKFTSFLLPATTLVIGLVIGMKLSPSLHDSMVKDVALTSASRGHGSKVMNVDDGTANGSGRPVTKTRVQERVAESAPKEVRVAIPLATMVDFLKKENFDYSSEFDDLGRSIPKALILLGATAREKEEMETILKKAEADMLAAEKIHAKLGDVTPQRIQIDLSAMRGSAEANARQIQDGIRSTLPADLAEGMISAIHWEKFYSTEKESSPYLEITRELKGKMTAWQKTNKGGSGSSIDAEFKDDGTPLPADRIFTDRWQPLLKGVTILPKDDE